MKTPLNIEAESLLADLETKTKKENYNGQNHDLLRLFIESTTNNKDQRDGALLSKLEESPFSTFYYEPPFDGSSESTYNSIPDPVTGEISVSAVAGNVHGNYSAPQYVKNSSGDPGPLFLKYRYNETQGRLTQRISFPNQNMEIVAKITAFVILPTSTADNRISFLLSSGTGGPYQGFVGTIGDIILESGSHKSKRTFLGDFYPGPENNSYYKDEVEPSIVLAIPAGSSFLDLNIVASLQAIYSIEVSGQPLPPPHTNQYAIADIRKPGAGLPPIRYTHEGIEVENRASGAIKIKKIKIELFKYVNVFIGPDPGI